MTEVLIATTGGPKPMGFMAFEESSFQEAVRAAQTAQIRKKRVQLTGRATTPILFKSDTKASILATNPGPYDLSGVGSGATIKATPDAGSEKTLTILATAGEHVGDTSPVEDLTWEPDGDFMIAVDEDVVIGAYRLVSLTVGPTMDTGSKIAAEMQSKIQALGGIYAAVTVAFATEYTITSGRSGTGSMVRIQSAGAADISKELKIGTANGGTNTDGTGNVSDLSAVTVAELIAAGMTGITLSDESGALKLESPTAGYGSKLVIGAGSANAVIGLTGSAEEYGVQGMGYSSDMLDALYVVSAVLREASSLVDKALSVNNPTVSGFDLICEDTSATDYVDVIVQ